VTWWQAAILGIVQGLTEFLPISSTAHLRIVPALAGWVDPGPAFTAVVQIGTLVAVVIYFWHDLVRIGLATLLGRGDPATVRRDAQMGQMMVVGTIPIVVAGLSGKPWIETTLRSLVVVSCALIGLAAVLAIAEMLHERRRRAGIREKQLADVGWWEAMVVGLAQAVALVPGSSRAGVTMTGAMFVGLARDAAARFSFLLSMPAVFAAGVYELYGQRHELLASSSDGLNLAICTVVSGVVGYGAIAFLLHFLRTRSMWVFIVYRVALGALILGLVAGGYLDPMK
jgi:undecaprenyl-diphosphatase